MTIDEAIAHAREVSSRKFDDRVHCIRCSEFHEQIAEWLEELKELREYFNSTEIGKYRFQKGYNKAVDDFADKMIIMMPGHKQDILQIAEQLKAGREYAGSI